ncbi:selenocysteine-specific translation elongation factor [Bacillus tianshenii]|uniref:selenocysteine-specific translation elongation factor n=1 Tax=Sutcliffiella tianshenii TaxID=1463404 RepID=UPI00296AC705|nr:selenocysteine-specific translation elongation factor [Bacillus tianshenii]
MRILVKHFTIGMAGHIDHGKTSLTKALTGVDTDRLKEEKERQISIEPGYAPLGLADGSVVSVVDVPGHERFIRQMIAGVSGIDLVILVIAADEGVMPQTKEHLEILKFLQVKKGMVAFTKIDKVDEEFLELAKEEIMDELSGTIFEGAPIVFVDSLKKTGIPELKQILQKELESVQEKHATGNFRLPIDQVFSLKGQGTVVRGTIIEGMINNGDLVEVMPGGQAAKVRQLQVHNKQVEQAVAGQRVAVNLSGLSKDSIKRGDVLARENTYDTTDTIDVSLHMVENLQYPIKQRNRIKVHIGTAEVLGKIVFFDRNEYDGHKDEDVLCQLRLDEPITCSRGDKVILRRPTPAETIGGGWIIQPRGSVYKFGQTTIDTLRRIKQGTPEERVKEAFLKSDLLSLDNLKREAGLESNVLVQLEEQGFIENVTGDLYAYEPMIVEKERQLASRIQEYHLMHPLRIGIPKAELFSELSNSTSIELIEFVLGKKETAQSVLRNENLVYLEGFLPSYPKQWQRRMEQVAEELAGDKLTPMPFSLYCEKADLPEKERHDLKYFLLKQNKAFQLDDSHLIDSREFHAAVDLLKRRTDDEVELGAIKDLLQLSRKYLIPFVELMDALGITEREGTARRWI